MHRTIRLCLPALALASALGLARHAPGDVPRHPAAGTTTGARSTRCERRSPTRRSTS